MKLNRNRSTAAPEFTGADITGHDPSKRHFLRLAGTGGAGLLIGGVIAPVSLPGTPEPACKTKDLSFWVDTLVGTAQELATLLPSIGPIVGKLVKIAKDFDDAYKRGDFANARALFTNISALISQIAADAGLNSPDLKLIFAGVSIAFRMIARLLDSQAGQSGVVAAMKKASPEMEAAAALVKKLADPAAADAIFAAARP